MGVVNRLRGMIHRGDFPDGRLPTEPALAVALQASRGTLRRALAQLEHEGLIIRKHGSGTYVNQAVLRIETRLDEVWDFSEMIRLAGYESSVEHIETRLEAAEPDLQAKLALEPGAEVIAVTNLFLADRQPVIYCLDVIPGKLVREAYAPAELHGPIYAFLQRRCHQQVSYNITEIHAVNAGTPVAAALQCGEGAALHYFDEVGYNASHQPILYSQEYYLPDLFCFQMIRRMMPDSPDAAARDLPTRSERSVLRKENR
jgi:GntR family transcriptional regulator